MRCDGVLSCPRCSERVVHLRRRGHESTTEYGQHIHDDLPNHFFWSDLDMVVYRKSSRVLRVIEHKLPGGRLSPSQEAILPLLQLGVESLIERDLVATGSGAYIIESDPPFTSALVTRRKDGLAKRLSGPDLVAFESGLIVHARSAA